MQKNDIVTAVISHVNEYGLDIEANGQIGFVQPIELSWTQTKQLTDFVVGERIDVLVYAITSERFYASIRQARPEDNPWASPSRFAKGTRYSGSVRNMLEWGCEVEIVSGVSAIILTSKYRVQAKVGDQLNVEIIDVDLDMRKIEARPVHD